MTIARNEFSSTFVNNHLTNRSDEEEKKQADGAVGASEGQESHSNVVVAKQKITLSKDASKKKKRIEVIQNSHPNNQAAANAGEDEENGFVSILDP